MKKNGFILYLDRLQPIYSDLTNEEAGQVFKAIIYHETHRGEEDYTPPVFTDRALKMVFTQIAYSLDQNARDYEDICRKRAEAGQLGGQKSGEKRSKSKQNKQMLNLPSKRSKSKQNEANEANKTDTETDTEQIQNRTDTDTKQEEEEKTPPPAACYGIHKNVILTTEQYEIIKNRVENYIERIDKASQGIKEHWKGYTPGVNHFDLIMKYARIDGAEKHPEPVPIPKPQKTISQRDLQTLTEQAEREGLERIDVIHTLKDYDIEQGPETSSGVIDLITRALQREKAYQSA